MPGVGQLSDNFPAGLVDRLGHFHKTLNQVDQFFCTIILRFNRTAAIYGRQILIPAANPW